MALKYKVGDRVQIKSLDWYNENKSKSHGTVACGSKYFDYDMREWCGKTMTILDVYQTCYIMKEDGAKDLWTDEMIDCLVERNGKTYPYKIGDRVVLKGNNRCATITDLKYNSMGNLSYYIKIDNDRHSIDYPTELLLPYKEPKFKVGDILFYRGETSGYLKVEEIREENGEIRYYETSRNLYLIENDPDVFADKVCSVEIEKTKSEDELLDNYEELTDRAFKGGYKKCKSDIELNGFQLPEGYQFVDENGNIINTQKIILEKKPDDKLKLESTKKVREYWSEYTRIFIEIYDDDPNECILTHLLTLEGHRQKGYAKKALAEAELIARELGCHKAHLKVETNSWMYNWYLKCGYNWYKNADEGYTWLTKSI